MLGYRSIVLFALFSTSAFAQWMNYSVPGTPRTRDGKPNLTAPAPRAADGKPDLSGVWHVQPTGMKEMKRLFGERADATDVPGMELDTISKYGVNILQDFKPDEAPIRPEAVRIQRARKVADFPATHCLPQGIPLGSMLSEPVKFVQSPQVDRDFVRSGRQASPDLYGRACAPKEFDQPAWMGYSVGRWDHDTLVVETAGFNDKTWLDIMGHPHSEALRMVERYRRRDFGHMDVEMTFDDPKMYTKPFTIKVTNELWADSDIFEFFCNENEKDRAHWAIAGL